MTLSPGVMVGNQATGWSAAAGAAVGVSPRHCYQLCWQRMKNPCAAVFLQAEQRDSKSHYSERGNCVQVAKAKGEGGLGRLQYHYLSLASMMEMRSGSLVGYANKKRKNIYVQLQ